MTLLDKLTYFLKPGLAILLIPFFFACNDPNDLGLELEPDENPFSLNDTTFTLPASTIYIDSLRTDHFNVTAFGKYQDSIYGEIKAISYNQYNVHGGSLPDNDSLEYQSVNIILKINAVRSNSLLNNQLVNIYKAKDTLFRQAVYLSNRSTPYEDEPIGSHTIGFPSDSIVSIPLSDEFGQSLYRRLKLATTDDDYKDSLTNNTFHFDPLVFVPGEDNNTLYSFNLSPDTVGIYVNMVNSFTGATSSFSFDFRDAHYVELQRDITGSQKLSNLTGDFEESKASSRTYLDMLAGVYTKIDLQPVLNFIDQQDNLLINLAQISLGVVNTNETGLRPAKAPIHFLFVKKYTAGADTLKRINGPGSVLTQIHSEAFTNAVLNETSYLSRGVQLFSPAYDKDNANYKGIITMFAQALADQNASDRDFLAEELVVLNPNPLGLGQTSFRKSEIQVTIYYTTLK